MSGASRFSPGRLFPGAVLLCHYKRTWLRGDVLAGITVAAYLIPQVMAYAEVAKLPAVTGLWAAVGPLAVYAVLGSSRQLSVGPESTTALMTASAVGALVGLSGGPNRHAEVAAVLAIAVGLLCIAGWFLKLGFVADLLSKPVLVGYMVGIALLMIVSQLGKTTGVPINGTNVFMELRSFAMHIGAAHVPTLILAGVVLTFLLVMTRLAPRWPAPLIAILAASAAVYFFDLTRFGLRVVGSVPSGLPVPRVPELGDLRLLSLLPAALGVAVVGYSNNVLTGRALAERRQEQIDSDQEFAALGVANVAAGLLQGFPVSSSGSRGILGDAMGSHTQMYSLVALAAVAVAAFVAGPVLATFPTAALGAVVIYAALRLIDLQELRRIARFRMSELVLAVSTTVAVLAFDVLMGIGVAIALSLGDLLRRIANPHDGVLGYVPGLAGMHDIGDYENARQVPGLVVYRYDSPLFFANAEDFTRRATAAVDRASLRGKVHWLVLNTEANVEVDLTSVDALDGLCRAMKKRGVEMALARVKQDLLNHLVAARFVPGRVPFERVYPTLPSAVAAYVDWYEVEFGAAPAGFIPPPPSIPT